MTGLLIFLSIFLWAFLAVAILLAGTWIVIGLFLFTRCVLAPNVRRLLGMRDPWHEPPFPVQQPGELSD
jgi:hypothetical protein